MIVTLVASRMRLRGCLSGHLRGSRGFTWDRETLTRFQSGAGTQRFPDLLISGHLTLDVPVSVSDRRAILPEPEFL